MLLDHISLQNRPFFEFFVTAYSVDALRYVPRGTTRATLFIRRGTKSFAISHRKLAAIFNMGALRTLFLEGQPIISRPLGLGV